MRLPQLSGDDCIRVLGRLGYVVDRTSGSHATLACPGRATFPVPRHNRDLGPGLLRRIIKEAGLSRQEFLNLYHDRAC